VEARVIRFSRLLTPLLAVAALTFLGPAGPAAAGGPSGLTRAVQAMAPGATAVPGGFRFRVDDVAVSVLADEGAGLLRVVARAGDLSDRDVGLVASALGPELVPDPGARVVSVRGFLCSAVLAPLRGLTEGVLRRAVDGAVQVARETARTAALSDAAEAGLPPLR
jgi:hypothetical protein